MANDRNRARLPMKNQPQGNVTLPDQPPAVSGSSARSFDAAHIQALKRNRKVLLLKFDEAEQVALSEPVAAAADLILLRQSLQDHLVDEENYVFGQLDRLIGGDETLRTEAHTAWIALGEVATGVIEFFDAWIAAPLAESTSGMFVTELQRQKKRLAESIDEEEVTLYALYTRSRQ